MGTASMTTGQFRELAGAVLRSLPDDLDSETAQRWIENQEKLRRALHEALANQIATNSYPISVDYEMSVEEAVKAGSYDWADPSITSHNFPNDRKGKIDTIVQLIHFNWPISTDQALHEMDKAGYCPTKPHEHLALGAKYPDLQREFPIVALGAVWQSRYGRCRYVLCLDGDGSERYMDLRQIEIAWREFYRFAAVRKSC